MKNVFLNGKNIYLRGLRKEDLIGNYFQWFNDQEVCRGNSHGYFPNTMEKMERYLEKANMDNENLVLAIIYKKNDLHIGNIALHSIDWIYRSAVFAIIIGEKKYWGNGLSKEASDLIMRHGFMMLNLHRIYCGTIDDNIPMQKLAAYMGMRKEGVMRQAFFKDGRYKDTLQYGVLRDEYLKLNKRRV